LVDQKISEDKTIEYKKDLKIGCDSDRKEFLADVSSFANTNGGDLVIGVEAESGIPKALSPLKAIDIDGQMLQIENVIRSGINPRISFIVRSVKTEKEDEYVIVIRINESWNKPHRVVFAGSNRFCARHSTGKYDLDVTELRQIFTLSDGIEKRIKDFITERVFALETEQSFLPLRSKNLIVLHLLPLEAFSTKINLGRDLLLSLENESALFEPMYAYNGWNAPRINLEGLSVTSSLGLNGVVNSYIQLFRNGSVEMVESSMLNGGKVSTIPYVVYEKEVVDGFKKGIEILKKVGMNVPIILSLSLINVRGLTMAENSTSGRCRRGGQNSIRQKNLILPAVVIGEYTESVEKLLQPTFDLVWNACGLPKSENYDPNGEFFITD